MFNVFRDPVFDLFGIIVYLGILLPQLVLFHLLVGLWDVTDKETNRCIGLPFSHQLKGVDSSVPVCDAAFSPRHVGEQNDICSLIMDEGLVVV